MIFNWLLSNSTGSFATSSQFSKYTMPFGLVKKMMFYEQKSQYTCQYTRVGTYIKSHLEIPSWHWKCPTKKSTYGMNHSRFRFYMFGIWALCNHLRENDNPHFELTTFASQLWLWNLEWQRRRFETTGWITWIINSSNVGRSAPQ